jgi:enamine deaminase RidA (YjgF/YER057c/UK114 family)
MSVTAGQEFVHVYGTGPGAIVPIGMRLKSVLYVADLDGVAEAAGAPVDGLVAQMDVVLSNMKAVLERSGYSLDNVARCTGYVTQLEDREPIYGPWDVLFPAADDRPAFKVLVAKLPPAQLVKLDMLAVADGRRTRIDIEGVSARDPTVMCGRFLFTSRVHGTDPATSKVKIGGSNAEIAQAFANILELAALAGVPVNGISQVTAFLRDMTLAAAVAERFAATFAGGGPPHFTILPAFIPEHLNVMLEMSAERLDVA